MKLQILNNDLSLHGIVAGFESLEFTRSWNNQGSFKLIINANNKNAKYIKIDKILYIDQNRIGYIQKVTLDRKANKAGERIVAEGVELKDHLNRVIYPNSGLENDSYTSQYLETIVKSLILKNAGSLAASQRQIPNLIVKTPYENRGLQMDYSARYKNLSQELYSLLSSQEMGLKATIDFANTNIVFDVAVGNDYTAQADQAGGIVLSLDTKTALQIVDVNDKFGFKNLSVTAGQGEGADRTIQEVYTEAAEPSGYNRREVFTEARDIESDNELGTRGAQKLGETQKARAITVKANNLGSYTAGDDYDLGDYISVDANGELYDSQVVKIKYKYSKDKVPETDIVLNFDTDDNLYSAIVSKHMNYDALLAKDGGGGTEHEYIDLTKSSSQTISSSGAHTVTHDGGKVVGAGELLERSGNAIKVKKDCNIRLFFEGTLDNFGSDTYIIMRIYQNGSTSIATYEFGPENRADSITCIAKTKIISASANDLFTASVAIGGDANCIIKGTSACMFQAEAWE